MIRHPWWDNIPHFSKWRFIVHYMPVSKSSTPDKLPEDIDTSVSKRQFKHQQRQKDRKKHRSCQKKTYKPEKNRRRAHNTGKTQPNTWKNDETSSITWRYPSPPVLNSSRRTWIPPVRDKFNITQDEMPAKTPRKYDKRLYKTSKCSKLKNYADFWPLRPANAPTWTFCTFKKGSKWPQAIHLNIQKASGHSKTLKTASNT